MLDLTSQRDLFSYVKSRLSESEEASCEGPLTLAEASEVLQRSNRNKSPGADGLTVEFYSQFWDKFGEPLVSVFKASVTRLVHKKDDKRLL